MKRRSILLFAVALVISVAGFFGWQGVFASPVNKPIIPKALSSTPSPSPLVVAQTAQTETRTPEAQQVARPVAVKQQSAPVVKSNSLAIPSIGFQGEIVDVGLTTGNAIDVPNGMQVGRWDGSAVPGNHGAVFLDGHLDGIFAKLHTVAVGQTLSVSYDGQVLQYRVAHSEVVALNGIDMNRALSVYGGASEGLNIMTCAGTYIPSAGTYDQRLVVYAVRV